ncbi:MAG: hypothetical protein ABMA25_10770 [Ilumatobacteraceae bacterium]
MAAFVVLCVALVAGSDQRRTGDAGEYMAMAWNITHLRPPALTETDLVRLDQHLADLEPEMTGFEGSALRLDGLYADGRYDQLHFWMYPLLASPFVAVANALDVPDTYGFAAFNILLLAVVLGAVLSRKGAVAAVLLFVSPLLWWLDKPHTELFIACGVLLALLWRHDRPLFGMAAMALAMSQNIAFGPVFGLYAVAVGLEHREALWNTTQRRLGLLAVAVIALVHPLYYLWRFGSFDATTASLDQTVRIPAVGRMVTPLLDPYVGLLMWWPFLVVVAVIGGLSRAWRRVPQRRSAAEWCVAWAPFAMACAVLFGQAQNQEPGSGGTFAMMRFAVWMSPFAVYGIDRVLFDGRLVRALVGTLAAASVLLSWHVARPSRPDVWFTVRPTFVAALLNDRAPWLWDSPPQVFLTREWRQFTRIEPVANHTCTKLLAVDGHSPSTCSPPTDVPDDCGTAAYCYANWTGSGFVFRPEDTIG